MGKKRIPWSKIRELYVSDETKTLEGLAEEFSIGKSTILGRSAQEKWADKRREYQEKVRIKAEEISSSAEARRRSKMLTLADSMKALAGEGLRRAIEDLSKNKAARLELAEIRLMIKDATEIERRALGMADVLLLTDEELDSKILRLAAEIADRGEGEIPPE